MDNELSIVNIQQVANLAWAAGIVDGEGSIGLHWNRGTTKTGIDYEKAIFKLMIAQSSNKNIPEILTRFRDIFNAGHIYGPYLRSKNPEHTARYEYRVHNNNALYILKLIWPYLGTVKKQQAIEAGYNVKTDPTTDSGDDNAS